jgi:hypothetical protein
VTVAFEPAGALEGFTDVMVGTGFGAAMVNGSDEEVPPPGMGLVTVTWTVPGVVNADDGTEACKSLWSQNCVGSATPLKLSTAVEAKFDPEAEIVIEPMLPAITLAGEIAVNSGTGYLPTLTVNPIPGASPPFGCGFPTVT